MALLYKPINHFFSPHHLQHNHSSALAGVRLRWTEETAMEEFEEPFARDIEGYVTLTEDSVQSQQAGDFNRIAGGEPFVVESAQASLQNQLIPFHFQHCCQLPQEYEEQLAFQNLLHPGTPPIVDDLLTSSVGEPLILQSHSYNEQLYQQDYQLAQQFPENILTSNLPLANSALLLPEQPFLPLEIHQHINQPQQTWSGQKQWFQEPGQEQWLQEPLTAGMQHVANDTVMSPQHQLLSLQPQQNFEEVPMQEMSCMSYHWELLSNQRQENFGQVWVQEGTSMNSHHQLFFNQPQQNSEEVIMQELQSSMSSHHQLLSDELQQDEKVLVEELSSVRPGNQFALNQPQHSAEDVLMHEWASMSSHPQLLSNQPQQISEEVILKEVSLSSTRHQLLSNQSQRICEEALMQEVSSMNYRQELLINQQQQICEEMIIQELSYMGSHQPLLSNQPQHFFEEAIGQGSQHEQFEEQLLHFNLQSVPEDPPTVKNELLPVQHQQLVKQPQQQNVQQLQKNVNPPQEDLQPHEREQNTSFRMSILPAEHVRQIMMSRRCVQISSEAPVLLAEACELFIMGITSKAWNHTEESKHQMLLTRTDISKAIVRTDSYHFLRANLFWRAYQPMPAVRQRHLQTGTEAAEEKYHEDPF